MLLTFSKKFPWGELTFFETKINNSLPIKCLKKPANIDSSQTPKIHSIRADETKRWKIGMAINFWMGSPRNPSVNPKNFANHKVIGIQEIEIIHYETTTKVYVDGRFLDGSEMKELAVNDGFKSTKEFLQWFKYDYKGRIIHWTNHKY